MAESRWPTIQEILDRVQQGIIDERTVTLRPTAEDLEAIRKDLEQFRASRAAQQDAPRPKRRKRPA